MEDTIIAFEVMMWGVLLMAADHIFVRENKTVQRYIQAAVKKHVLPYFRILPIPFLSKAMLHHT